MSIVPPRLAHAAGLQERLQEIATTIARMLQTRGALFALELHEELARRKRALLLGLLVAACLHMALLVSGGLLVALFWDTHRLAAMGALCVAYLAGAAAGALALRAHLAHFPPPFEASMAELGRDLVALGSARP